MIGKNLELIERLVKWIPEYIDEIFHRIDAKKMMQAAQLQKNCKNVKRKHVHLNTSTKSREFLKREMVVYLISIAEKLVRERAVRIRFSKI